MTLSDECEVIGEKSMALTVPINSDGLPWNSDPLFVLASPRSFTSLVCAMLGQHPQSYGLPELHLFVAETIGQWWSFGTRAGFSHRDGALRAMAELFFGTQTEDTVREARAWLRRRWHISTGLLMELFVKRVSPRMVVEKSPSITYSIARMERAHRMFPKARYIHLLRHPRTQAESMIIVNKKKRERGIPVPRYWVDPPLGWYANNRNISAFLTSIPTEQHIRVRAEDLLTDPDRMLHDIAEWLGLRTDPEAIEEMKHPERSPYACLGPKGAKHGCDANFLSSPELRPGRVTLPDLTAPLSWRKDGSGLPPRVAKMARDFGYH